MQVQIKFRRTGSNSVYGSFATGDIIRCDKSLAEHYVREGVAVYLPEPSKSENQPEPEEQPKSKARKNREEK